MVRTHSRACRLSVTPRKQPPELDPGGQLAALLECGPDRSSLCLTDDEHHWSKNRAWLKVSQTPGMNL
jgi:hypothetical protein